MKISILCLFFLLCFSIYSLPGDADNNGRVDIIDALKIAQYYVGMRFPGFYTTNADVDVNGSINIIDALIVAQYYVGVITYFPSSTYKRLPVPLVKQNPDMCGAACGMMYMLYKRTVLGSSGLTLPSQTDIYNLMRASDPAIGTAPGVTETGLYIGLNNILYQYTKIKSQAYTRLYLLSNSTPTDNRSFAAQLGFIDLYEPSIVYLHGNSNAHFVVMTGFNVSNNEVLCNDPYRNALVPISLNQWLDLEYISTTKERLFIAKDM